MTGRMEVLVNGEWVDVSNTVRDFEFERAEADEVTAADDIATPASFDVSIPIDPEQAAPILALIEEADRRHRAERARRRLWLRFPYRGANRSEETR